MGSPEYRWIAYPWSAAILGRMALLTRPAQFSPEGVYLDTATYGLPPRDAFEAFQRATDEWRHGRCGFNGWHAEVERSRASFARLVGADAGDVAVGHVVSPMIGLIAASLPAGAVVVAAEEEFTSVLFPFLAAGTLDVRLVPLERIADAIDGSTHLVAVSSVQSADGRRADLDAIAAAARHHGARTLVDATQSVGWLPLDATRFDAVAVGAYKWLMSPRGTAFLTVSPAFRDELRPLSAGWCAAPDPSAALYGAPLRLAAGARRFDVSPAWLNWVATAPALELIEHIGVDAIHAHDVALADGLRTELGMEPAGSAIVSLAADDATLQRLRGAGIRGAGRAGRLRLAFHLYNDERDLDAVLWALRGTGARDGLRAAA
jgi:selenocysteine lyase/cysteine desulfurase